MINLRIERTFYGVCRLGYFKAFSGEGFVRGADRHPVARFHIYEFGITNNVDKYSAFKPGYSFDFKLMKHGKLQV